MAKLTAQQIQDHEKRMEKYQILTSKSVDSSTHYTDENININEKIIPRCDSTAFYILASDSVSAVMNKKTEGKTALLNFASYKHPGGGYLIGSSAQEECLCQESNLYSVLKAFDDSIYEQHRHEDTSGLYKNFVIYSPEIIFREFKKADVITCAAPNAKVASSKYNIPQSQIKDVMANRIDFLLKAAYNQNVDTLILGAFGCGVFGNDAEFVAKTFKSLLQTKYKNAFKVVIFAIPQDSSNKKMTFQRKNDSNLTTFQKVFDERG